MNLEQSGTQAASRIGDSTAKNVEKMVRKAWSIMDAASEKRSPSEYLNPQAIRAIQGIHEQ